MWGTTVKVNGREYFVFGTPKTPDSELLMKAVRQAEENERAAKEADPHFMAYSAALRSQ